MSEKLTLPLHAPVFLLYDEPSPYPELGCTTRYTAVAQPSEPNGRMCSGVGKGRTAQTRKLSAVGEAVERHHFFHSDAHRTGSAQELDAPFVPYAHLGLPLYETHTHRDSVSNEETECFAWSEATDLTTSEKWYVPHEVGGKVRGGYRPTTSGWAAHSPRFAAGRALLELIERDAALLSWYCTDFGEEIADINDSVLNGIRQLGFEVRCFLLTKDVAVPVIWAWARGKVGGAPLLKGASVMSSASAFVVDDAIRSAIDGIVQKLEYFSKRPCVPLEAIPVHPMEHVLYYLSPAAGDELDNLVGQRAMVDARQLSIRFRLSTVTELAIHLKALGFRALVVDETKDYARFTNTHVFRAVVPGLLPMSFGPSERGRISRLCERAARAGCKVVADPSCLPPHPFA